ncbi:glucosyl-dolichyl phosphate glucuronosyltransferase [Halovivax gelatinilyticus]|uniref:glucosyl-dolichyl phosphate glucuronosyltransferase n=1 Tax=Halovivax gelatinilyticus TaxID=2961597 RepID=UPI0020CA7AD7|nr:glucosyl-dolichyl phosphate glucuronosyltransferase [Halovivax gelatinilyticus]
MEVSVVICTYTLDRYDAFVESVDSVLSQTYDTVEVVIVVDGCPETYERVEADFGGHSDVIVHNNETNRGVSFSRTVGAELASGEVVAFIDDDAVAERDWVKRLVRTYEETDAVAVGGRMVGDWLAGRPWYLPKPFDWVVGVTYPGFADPGEEVRNTFESNLSFRRDVFLELGGFNPALGPDADSYSHSEGAEIGVRLQAKFGKGVVYEPDAVVEHKIFEYRTSIRWLLRRAFEQGRSKRTMATAVGGSSVESSYLRQLFVDFTPTQLRQLASSPSIASLGQLLMLYVFTVVVGFGYVFEGAYRIVQR